MDTVSGLLLFGAGVAGGVVTAVVGGASLITFPALMAAGLPTIVANASNAVALVPGNFVAGIADLERLPRGDRSFVRSIAVCAAGSLVGAGLLLMTSEQAFTRLVPILIGAATALFAAAGPIQRRIAARASRPDATARPSEGLRLLLLAPVAVYGGYFGAGMSVMLLAILSISGSDDFRSANVRKNLISGVTSLVAVVVFVAQGMVAWPQATVMMGGAIIGGFAGGRLVRVLPPRLVRRIVITVGSVLTAVYAWRYWFP